MKGLVWGYTFKDGCEKMDEIKENYLRYNYNIISEHRNKTRYELTFDNGDYWKVMRACESSRGCKANLSYIDRRIQDMDIVEMIHYCTVAGPWNAIKCY